MATKNNKAHKVVNAAVENQVVSNEPVVSEEMAVKYAGLGKEFIKVGIIAVALMVLLVVLWLILK